MVSVPSLNLECGLSALRGQAGKYLTLLDRLLAQHADDMAQLARSL